jgi:hypothetical protein
MKKFLFIFLIVSIGVSSCGPDLDPQKYLVKSITLASFEEYTFHYQNDKLQKLVGTDSITLNYSYYSDSTSIIQKNKAGNLTLRTRLSYSAGELTKVKIQWRFGQSWYKDSISFDYNSSNLISFTYKQVSNQVSMQNGNLTNFKRGNNALTASYSFTHDQYTNPLESVYWLTPFILPSGNFTIIQPYSIARYFSKNNIKTSVSTILTASTTERYSYVYLHDILPKSINYEVETSKNLTKDLVYVFDIQYQPKEVWITSQ